MINLDNFTLLDILPPNLIHSDEDRALALAITEGLKKVIKEVNTLDPTTEIPEELLDIIAWGEHVDFYNPSLSVEQKRKLIANASVLHSQKGTPFAVEQAGAIILKDAKVEEWFEYDGEPFFFKLKTTDLSVTNEKLDALLAAIETVKNKRSRVDKIVIEMSEEMNVYYAAALHTGEKIIIK